MNILSLGAAANTGFGSYGFFIILIVFFAIMYFVSIRPQKKQQQKRQDMLKQMAKGDKVVTLGGIKGVVESVDRDNKEVVVDADGIYLTFDINFIRNITPADKDKTSTSKNANVNQSAPAETKDDKVADTTTDDKPAEAAKPEDDASDKDDRANSDK